MHGDAWQVLVKSCKMVPVMVVGTLLHGKRYSPLEYLCMMLVGVGVALFGSQTSSSVKAKLANPNTALGYSLCFVSLAFDGYTNAVQVWMHRPALGLDSKCTQLSSSAVIE